LILKKEYTNNKVNKEINTPLDPVNIINKIKEPTPNNLIFNFLCRRKKEKIIKKVTAKLFGFHWKPVGV